MIDDASPRTSESLRLNDDDAPWPARPWIMAALCAAAGLGLHLLIDDAGRPVAAWRSAAATALMVSTIVFLLGVEQRRWHWALGFALLWGLVMGLIAWQTSGYNLQGSPVEWPFWSGMLALLVATPLFQTRRDVAPDWRFWKLWSMPYQRLHDHGWADAVLGAAGLAFVAVSFLLAMLIAEMFHLIGIDLLRDLMRGGWFGWMLAGGAFGGAIGLLRERDRLVAILQRLVMTVLAILAPILGAALAIFLLSLLVTGLGKLWASGFSTAALMLAASAFSVLLANAVIGSGREAAASRVLRFSAALLAVGVLPLAAIAAVSMGLRIGQYGWTPERIWGVIAVAIALGYGLGGLWAAATSRSGFADVLRPFQQKLGIAVMLLALILALPIIDFGAISARDQVARLRSGTTSVAKFDWAAMAFDFGPEGRAMLEDLARSPDTPIASSARTALAAVNRYDLAGPRALEPRAPIGDRLRILPAGAMLPGTVRDTIANTSPCSRAAACAAILVSDDRIALLSQQERGGPLGFDMVTRGEKNDWVIGTAPRPQMMGKGKPDLLKAQIEVRSVEKKQIFVDGVAESESFD